VQLTLGLVGGVLAVVAGLGQLAQPAVVLGVRLGVLDHRLDLVVRQSGAGADLDLLLLAGAQVLGRHVEDAVGVDVESDLDLRMPRGAGGIPVSWNLPSDLLYLAISRSPCRTWISTLGWLSSAVENTSPLRVGIVVLRSISLVITPPLVSMRGSAG